MAEQLKSKVNSSISLDELTTFNKGTTLLIGNVNVNINTDNLFVFIDNLNLSFKELNEKTRLFYEGNKKSYLINCKPEDFKAIKAFDEISEGSIDTIIISKELYHNARFYSQFLNKDGKILLVDNKKRKFDIIEDNKKRDISIFQIYYNQETKDLVEKSSIPFYNKLKDGYYENSVIKQVRDLDIDSDYIGVSSPIQIKKTNIPLIYIQKLIELNKDVDVFNYSPIIDPKFKGYDLWKRHKSLNNDIYRLAVVLNKSKILPFDLFEKPWQYNLGNYWVAKKEVFNWYTDTVLSPTINFLNNNRIVLDILKQEHRGDKNHKAYTFLLEGLFGSFLANTQFNHQYVFDTFEMIKFFNIKGAKYNKLISPEININ